MTTVVVAFRRRSSFVDRDIGLLAKHYSVIPFAWNHITGPFALARIAANADVIFSWFAGAYAAFASYLGRFHGPKTITNLGGYDCVGIPEIRFGAFLNPILSLQVKVAVARSDVVTAVDPSLISDLRQSFPTPREILVIPTGYDSAEFFPTGSKEDIVLSVGEIDRAAALRKGLFTFAEVARKMKDLTFVLAGPILTKDLADELVAISGGRLHLTGRLDWPDLIRYYQRAKVYCQLSRHEGLPNGVCEAMLCECVPVGTEHGGIPTAIGTTGAYCVYGDVSSTCAAIEAALNMNGGRARERIRQLFPIARRERSIVEIIDRLADHPRVALGVHKSYRN